MAIIEEVLHEGTLRLEEAVAVEAEAVVEAEAAAVVEDASIENEN